MTNKEELKIKLNNIINSLNSLTDIGNKKDINFKLSYRIANISKAIEPIVTVYQEAIKSFMKSNSLLVEDNIIKFKTPEDKIKYLETNEDLLNEYHSIDIKKIPIDLFSEYNIEPNHIKNILWMIEGEL